MPSDEKSLRGGALWDRRAYVNNNNNQYVSITIIIGKGLLRSGNKKEQ